MKNLLKKLFFGDIVITEYSTVTIHGAIQETVWLDTGKRLTDISSNHWLLCLNPIVFGIWIENKNDVNLIDEKNSCKIYFKDSGKKNANTVATLTMDFFEKILDDNGILFLLKLNAVRISHTSFIKTFLLFFRYYKKPGLSFSKLKSYAAAYSYPRRVRVISFKQDDYYNIFPMDLLGSIPGCNKHVFGLRHTNIALPKIIETGKMVVSEIPYEYKDIIYKLGSHHSVAPPSLDMLPFKVLTTEKFGFYIPEWAENYKEVQITRTINLGSHMLLWGEWEKENKLKAPGDHLYHIHFLHYLHQAERSNNYKLV